MQVTINNELMTVVFQTYAMPPNTSIQVFDSYQMPYCKVTTNIEGLYLPPDRVLIFDSSTSGETYKDKFIPVDELCDAGIIRPTEYLIPSGFNMYRIYELLVNEDVDNE